MQLKQGYFNIAAGVIISILVACILGAFGWIAKMQQVVTKADLALHRIERNEQEVMRKNKVYHGRLGKNADAIKEVRDMAMRANVQSAINFQLYMGEHK